VGVKFYLWPGIISSQEVRRTGRLIQGSVDGRGFNLCVFVCVNIRKQNKIYNVAPRLSSITFCQIAFSHSNTSPGLVSRFSETVMQKTSVSSCWIFQCQCKKGNVSRN
jgi:hypothetical protein